MNTELIKIQVEVQKMTADFLNTAERPKKKTLKDITFNVYLIYVRFSKYVNKY